MDVHQRIADGLPQALEEIEAEGHLAAGELWLLARAYSRLRHRTSPRRQPRQRKRYEALKAFCVRLAIEREPGHFLIFPDPEKSNLWLIYHRLEQTLLHLPNGTDLGSGAPG